MATKQLGMVIDTVRCVGCTTCAVACKGENNLPDKTWYNRVLTVGGPHKDTPAGVFPRLSIETITLACQHCAEPRCLDVCPVGAISKRAEDGVVIQDLERCIGDRACMAACPYTGVRVFNWEEPTFQVDFPVGGKGVPAHLVNKVEKCQMCAHRLAEGLEPACVEVCPARARHFGDLNDPDSKVSRLLRRRHSFTLLPEKHTGPSIHFLD
jgi:molybdopterin-containing oxidoreductase family iron-sulfur binding subunit